MINLETTALKEVIKLDIFDKRVVNIVGLILVFQTIIAFLIYTHRYAELVQFNC
jgi:cell division protein FtsL